MTYEELKKLYIFARNFEDIVGDIYMTYHDFEDEEDEDSKKDYAIFVLVNLEKYYHAEDVCRAFGVKNANDIMDEIIDKKREEDNIDIDWMYWQVRNYLRY